MYNVKAAALLRGVFSFSLRSQQGWQLPLFIPNTSLLRGRSFSPLPVSCETACNQAERRSFHGGFLVQEHDTARQTSGEVQGWGTWATSAEKLYPVRGQLASCMPSAIKDLPKITAERVLLSVSIIPEKEASSNPGCPPEGVISPQASPLETCVSRRSVPHEKGSPKESSSPFKPADDDQPPSAGSHKKARERKQGPCEHEGCRVMYGNYGFPDVDGTRCYRHRQLGMAIVSGGCSFPGCITQASYNFPGQPGKLWCSVHKEEGMVNKKRRVCQMEGCTGVANYGREGEDSPSRCVNHVERGMIVIEHAHTNRCGFPGCLSRKLCGYASDNRKVFCLEHKEEGMVNLATPQCEEEGCTKRAMYRWSWRRAKVRCREHREDGMVPEKKCEVEGCVKQPAFGFPGDKTRVRCKAHAEKGMVYHNKKGEGPEGHGLGSRSKEPRRKIEEGEVVA